ncbi:MAG TPA: Rieske (2Fe-2S) protein [Longimicrobiaceae bacterium]|nr:Rieske (2Fe-2S) protein [Longimicrobiaceae bacterium]
MDETCAGCGGMGRRQFIAAGTMAAAALLLAACSGDATGAQPSLPLTVKVSDYPALASVGGVALVSNSVAVVRTAGGYLALSRVCPHQGATVNASGGGFTCPRHGARFDASGTWVGGERTSSMRQLNTQYDAAAGTLTVS